MNSVRRTRAEIDHGALAHNLAELRRLAAGGTTLLGVVKADAYGHGAAAVSRTLEAGGIDALGVSLVEEGVALREAHVHAPIVVLGASYGAPGAERFDLVLGHALTPVVSEIEHLTALDAAARTLGRGAGSVDFHIKVDTGMSRLGVLPEDLPALLAHARGLRTLRLAGVLSHLANADSGTLGPTAVQRARFDAVLAELRAADVAPGVVHLANSAGFVEHDSTWHDAVRPGLLLYGVAPSHASAARTDLRPVMRWSTEIVALRDVPAGTGVSYGHHFVTARPTRLATLAVGYADGYPRALGGRAQVLVRGRRAPVVGSVCMDMCMVDVTDVPGVERGDEVVLLGPQGAETVGADELAAHAHTLSYEILCGVGARVPRVHVGDARERAADVVDAPAAAASSDAPR